MELSWFGDFFSTLPDAFQALYEFGDPSGLGRGWWGFLILGIWGVFLVAVPFALARHWYGRREWASAAMGALGGLAVLWWIFGILPSAWIYFLDSNKELLEGAVIPGSFGFTLGGTRYDVASNLYDVIRDTVVVLEHLVGFVAVFWAALKIQQRLPRTLLPGEERPESGGYH